MGAVPLRSEVRSRKLSWRPSCLRHGEVVSSDRLMDDVWGERASAGMAKTLQVYVWQLRRAFEPGRLPGSRRSCS